MHRNASAERRGMHNSCWGNWASMSFHTYSKMIFHFFFSAHFYTSLNLKLLYLLLQSTKRPNFYAISKLPNVAVLRQWPKTMSTWSETKRGSFCNIFSSLLLPEVTDWRPPREICPTAKSVMGPAAEESRPEWVIMQHSSLVPQVVAALSGAVL